MKKIAICFVLAASLYACSNNTENTANKSEAKVKTTDVTNDPAFTAGLELVRKSDCFTCHKIDEASTGPAYRLIANKYTAADSTIKMLASKIIKGGTGNWGTIPMTAHPDLSEADVTAMVKYVLMLKK